jgi:nucleoside-diphosphate-sugar epimerase
LAILITGGTGFLGSHLARRLVLDEGRDDVVLFDRFPSDERISDIRDRVAVVTGDILEPQELLATLKRYDIDRIAHFAFMAGTAHPEKIVPYSKLTCVGTATVFEAARIHGIRRVVNASSMAVYGKTRGDDLTEDDAPQPTFLYGAAKLWTEHLADVFNGQHGMEILSLRVCATMGPGRLNRASLVAGLMGPEYVHFMALPEVAALGQPVTMPPDDQPTEYLYAADAALAFALALAAPRPEHSVFNLKAERRLIGELTSNMRRLLPDAQIEVSAELSSGEWLISNDRLRSELGFEPRYTLETGLEAYLEQVRGRRAAV